MNHLSQLNRVFWQSTAGLWVGLTLAASGADQPNLVLILADDLGIGDVECYGGDRCAIDTPHIDAMAAGGMRFTDAHVNASVCVPTRRALMTGRYAWRFGPPTGSGPWGFVGPRPNTEKSTLGKMLGAAGYTTGYVGKWHLGTVMTTTDGGVQGPDNVDFTQPLKFGAPQFGFDESFILPGSLDMFPYAFVRNNVWQGKVTAQKGWSAFNRVGPAEENFEDHKVLETFYQEAEAFIAKQNGDQPFFLFLALTAPHTPTSPGAAWQGRSELGVYGDFVMEVDHSVERVMGALRKSGLGDDTLVIFTSDHGAACYAGNILEATPGQLHDLEKKGHYSAGPHRGFKFSVYEGGLRVPFVAHWPDAIPAGSQCEALVGLNDVMATFAELAGTKLDDDEAPDSVSFANLLRDPGANPKRTTLVMQSAQESFAVRDGPWKLCLCPGSGAKDQWLMEPLSGRSWQHALRAFDGAPSREDLQSPPFVQLFDLSEDPHEDHNLAADHPDRVAAMVAMLKEQIENGRSTPGPKLSNDKNVLVHQRMPDFVRKVLRP